MTKLKMIQKQIDDTLSNGVTNRYVAEYLQELYDRYNELNGG